MTRHIIVPKAVIRKECALRCKIKTACVKHRLFRFSSNDEPSQNKSVILEGKDGRKQTQFSPKNFFPHPSKPSPFITDLIIKHSKLDGPPYLI